ncbi:pyridoxamine 5'-phosphate oxidase family protein [Nocardioides sp. zg-536]|uniref:Pyridoxamine 5'-phosphate oxidase family protein n=1 Tax=Nocardioides faecalis TaxID=2803858 RepID=A0A938YC00_9ACTN|nr:pyridoxamine 5'-phosphate oxidase family protein [Nocardioides faecalis]MBM9461565.1 pyridoxamine 5'-phosphate oxidase family protein [Nocardioides faecalis]MBS4752525.1 pyridoxamine 5'-phosphate oxidase family protein [Nocardioides faecalis]QVI57801.1 pyridoxamine 5'-phosphate oxidase family protein [Nocardioides faecalis]
MQVPEERPGRIVELSSDECWDLLHSRAVGRVAWSGANGTVIIPVNFVAREGLILFRTTPYSMLARDCAEREVSFEVDDLDEDEHTGWSVLARGRCTREERSSDGPAPWVTGPRVLGLKVEVSSVSGRRVLPPVSRSAGGST